MNIYIVTEITQWDKLHEKMDAHIEKHDRFALDNAFMIASDLPTAKDLAQLLGIDQNADDGISGVVLNTRGYWGNYVPALWEWMESKTNAV